MSHPTPETVLDDHDLQGDGLAGFRKDHTAYVFLRITDVRAAKKSLAQLVPRISPLADVAMFNEVYRSKRHRRGVIAGTLTSTWVNVGFTATGLSQLTHPDQVGRFDDAAFRNGMVAQSASLGDPVDPDHPGHHSHWLFGGSTPGSEVDVVVIAAADEGTALADTTAAVRELLCGHGFDHVYSELCVVDPAAGGREHFGFRDGISQPGVRGTLSSGMSLTPRYLDPEDPRAASQSRPGQPLVWPGEFVLGLPRQPPTGTGPPAAPRPATPAWAANGSFLVVRRLVQDVGAFRAFLSARSAELAARPGLEHLTAERLAAMLIGRWPSGAPVTRSPDDDDAALGSDDFAANDFGYVTSWGVDGADEPPRLRTAARLPPGVGRTDTYPPGRPDAEGLLCPHAAHVRKVNPRDQQHDRGGAPDTLRRRILRRGAPFGPRYDDDPDAERGLMFSCYQSSIFDQFQFLMASWVRGVDRPSADPGGVDLLLTGGSTEKSFILGANGATHDLTADPSWVRPSGGGYFFTPSIPAIRDVLCA